MANETYQPALSAPQGVQITDAPDYNGQSMGKIRKMILFQSINWVSDTAMGTGTTTEILDTTEWNDALGAVDGTRASVVAYMDKAIGITGGEPNQADNDGYMYSTGSFMPSLVEGQFEAPTPAVLLALQELYTYRNLYAMFINENDQLIHAKDASAGTVPQGFATVPKSFKMNDPTLDPATGLHIATFSFQLKPQWYGGGFTVIAGATTGSFLEDLINT